MQLNTLLTKEQARYAVWLEESAPKMRGIPPVIYCVNFTTANRKFCCTRGSAKKANCVFIHPQHASLVDCCNSENNLFPFGHSNTKVEGYTTNPRCPMPEQVPDYMLPMLEGLQLNPEDYSGRVADIRKAVQARKRELGQKMDCGYDTLSDDQLSDAFSA